MKRVADYLRRVNTWATIAALAGGNQLQKIANQAKWQGVLPRHLAWLQARHMALPRAPHPGYTKRAEILIDKRE